MQLKLIREAGSVMNQVTQKTDQGNTDVSGSGVAASDAASPSRRRLIKLGAAAVPVVATLASRPALAWHCQSTSAWGSTMVGTSLQHTDTTSFETWYINDWKDNVVRSAAGSSAPWNYVKQRLNNGVRSSDITCGMLRGIGINCAGASDSTKVRTLLAGNDSHKKATIVAQLNLMFTQNQSYKDIMSSCHGGAAALNLMANDNYYQPDTRKWTKDEIVTYLSQNWIAQ